MPKSLQINRVSPQNASSAPSILIILMGSLGDVARGLCLISHIKENLPRSRITWLVEPKWADLVELNQRIDRVVIFQRAWRISAVGQLYRELRQEQFDVCLDLQRIFKSGFFSLLSGARRRIGFHRRNAKEFNWIFNNEHIGCFSDDLPKIGHYLKFTEHLGLPACTALDFGLSSPEVARMAPGIIRELQHPFAAIILGTSWKSKNWYYEGYVGLLQRILASGALKVVLLGDDSQADMATNLISEFNTPDLISLVGQTSLPQLAAVLQAAALGIGPDSGPGHVSAAVKTPFVTLFGPTSPQRTAPFGSEQLVVTAEADCAPCYKKRCTDQNRQCMKSIHPEAVMEKVSLVLAGIKKDSRQ